MASVSTGLAALASIWAGLTPGLLLQGLQLHVGPAGTNARGPGVLTKESFGTSLGRVKTVEAGGLCGGWGWEGLALGRGSREGRKGFEMIQQTFMEHLLGALCPIWPVAFSQSRKWDDL